MGSLTCNGLVQEKEHDSFSSGRFRMEKYPQLRELAYAITIAPVVFSCQGQNIHHAFSLTSLDIIRFSFSDGHLFKKGRRAVP